MARRRKWGKGRADLGQNGLCRIGADAIDPGQVDTSKPPEGRARRLLTPIAGGAGSLLAPGRDVAGAAAGMKRSPAGRAVAVPAQEARVKSGFTRRAV
jgi:hypothetical protein